MKFFSRPSQVKLSHVSFLVLIFITTRIWAWLSGMRYSTAQAASLWQLLDLDLLHHHLFHSLHLLHAQPPGLNLLVGLAQKAAGANFGYIIVAVQLLLAIAAILAIYLALIALEVTPLWPYLWVFSCSSIQWRLPMSLIPSIPRSATPCFVY
jgi:hypothetical protein